MWTFFHIFFRENSKKMESTFIPPLVGIRGPGQGQGQETTLDPIWQIMLIPVGRYCSISGRIYFLCNLLHRFGVSTHFSYTCRKGQKKRTSGPNSGQILMRLSLNRFFVKYFFDLFAPHNVF